MKVNFVCDELNLFIYLIFRPAVGSIEHTI